MSWLKEVCCIECCGGPSPKRIAQGGHSQDSEAKVIWQPHLARAFREIDCIREYVAGNVGLVAFASVPVRANPGDLVALDEPTTNLIDAANDAGCSIVLHDQVLINRVSSPGLSSCHRRYLNLAQLARLFQAAIPLANGSLPLADGYRLSTHRTVHVATDSRSKNIDPIVR